MRLLKNPVGTALYKSKSCANSHHIIFASSGIPRGDRRVYRGVQTHMYRVLHVITRRLTYWLHS